MSKTAFYYLKIDGKFVKLQDIDEVLCHLLGIEVSDEKYTSINNLLGVSIVHERYTLGDDCFSPCVKRMVIPERVKSLRAGFFRGGLVENELIFPATLTSIGSQHEDCVLANTRLSKVVLPNSLEMIGCFAFGNSIIEELVYSQKMFDYPYLQQFKGSKIKHLFIPKELFYSVFEQKEKAIVSLQAYDATIDNIRYYDMRSH